MINPDRLDGSVSQLRRSEPKAPCLDFPYCQNPGYGAGFSSAIQAYDGRLIPYFAARLPTKNAFPTINQPSSHHFPAWLSPLISK